MSYSRLAARLPATLLAALALACAGKSSESGDPDRSGGAGGMAGSGNGGAGGSGGGVAQECLPAPLSEYCAERACPASPDQVVPVCSGSVPGLAHSSRGSTPSGGTYVVASDGLSGTGYCFDAQGTLVGVITRLSDTTPIPCPPGYMWSSYGTLCQFDFNAPRMNLCAGGSGAGGYAGASTSAGSAGAGGA